MRNSLLTLALLLAGCGSSGQDYAQTEADIPAQLYNVKNCFYAATHLLQREPEGKDEMPAFLNEAKRIVKNGGDSQRGDFSKLNWSPDGNFLLTSGGRTINCTLIRTEHDNYGPGNGTAFVNTYCLTVEGTEHSSTFGVEMSFGR